jgi:23S rRNA pseudouridine1911/1915/1917 synthase
MSQPDTLVLEQSLPRERLDRHLATLLPGVSRASIQRLIIEGRIKINGSLVKPTHPPQTGDVVSIHWPSSKVANAKAQDIPLEVLFEDEDLIVLNKPADLVVHPSAGHEDGTIVNALLHHCRGELSGVGGVERPGIVHRLDLGTSGCLVVAKNDRTHISLTEKFQLRQVEKIYQAIVCGELESALGDIRANIDRHATQRQRMAVVAAGRFARTTYQRLERLPGSAFVEAKLHTGRTHQIRVHFKHIGFPVFGDEAYGKVATKKLTEATGVIAARQMLHARKLTFRHPRDGRFCEFDAPLPQDFRDVLAGLREFAVKHPT